MKRTITPEEAKKVCDRLNSHDPLIREFGKTEAEYLWTNSARKTGRPGDDPVDYVYLQQIANLNIPTWCPEWLRAWMLHRVPI